MHYVQLYYSTAVVRPRVEYSCTVVQYSTTSRERDFAVKRSNHFTFYFACKFAVKCKIYIHIEHVMHIHTAVDARSTQILRESARPDEFRFRTSCPQSTAFITRVLRPPRALSLEATAQGRGRCLYSSSSDDKTCAWLDLLPEPPHGGRPGEIASDLNLLCCFGVFGALEDEPRRRRRQSARARDATDRKRAHL